MITEKLNVRMGEVNINVLNFNYFVAMVLQGLIANGHYHPTVESEAMAQAAILIARAVMKQLENEKGR